VSVYPSFKTTSTLVAKWLLQEANNSYFLVRTFSNLAIGICALIFFAKLSYTVLEKWNRLILTGVLAIMITVLVVWKEYNGARWWLDIPGLPSIQPVEFAKIGIIVFLASFMKKKRALLASFSDWAIPYFAIVWSLFLLLALQPDFGSILILAPVLIALYFVGGWNSRYILILFLIWGMLASSIYGLGKLWTWEWSERSKLSYISERIDSFFQDNNTLFSKKESDGKDYQIKQGLIAIWSGWFWGLGFWKSIQKFGYLPEVQWDFIFSVIVEELGFVWALCLLSIYLTIVYRGYMIARWVKDPFGKYTAFGLSTLILVQVFINVGVNLNVIPLTWVTLPFVSYGGSSLIALLSSIGILLNISRYMEYHTPSTSYNFAKKRRVY
jgi:cell division protein FtsW